MKTLVKALIISILIIGAFGCEKNTDDGKILLFEDNFDTLNLEIWKYYTDYDISGGPTISTHFGNSDKKNNCLLVFATIMELFMGPTYVETKTVYCELSHLDEYNFIQFDFDAIYASGEYAKFEVVNKTNDKEVLYTYLFEEDITDYFSNKISIQLNPNDTLLIGFTTKAIGNSIGELYVDNIKIFGIVAK